MGVFASSHSPQQTYQHATDKILTIIKHENIIDKGINFNKFNDCMMPAASDFGV